MPRENRPDVRAAGPGPRCVSGDGGAHGALRARVRQCRKTALTHVNTAVRRRAILACNHESEPMNHRQDNAARLRRAAAPLREGGGR